jgi:hypothetical protein
MWQLPNIISELTLPSAEDNLDYETEDVRLSNNNFYNQRRII